MRSPHPLSAEGYALMGAAFEVHNVQGGGLAEEIYQQSLEIELQLRNIPFVSKQQLTCFYKGRQLAKTYVPDLIVYEILVVELKAVSQITEGHFAQVINYMRLTGSPVAYLINFGPVGKLEYRRIILSETADER